MPHLNPMLRFAPLLALLTACAHDPHQAMTQDYYRDAQVCRAQSPLGVSVRVNRSGIADQRLDAGVDPNQYLLCMNRLGWRQERHTDPLLKAMATCQQQAGHAPTASATLGSVKLTSNTDRAAFRECLKQRGFEGEVVIEPLEPAQSH